MAATPTGQRPTIAAEAFLRSLADHGTDYFFVNPGTDFPPIVEAFSRAKKTNAKVPKPILVPHENLAVGMAHGAYMMTGRPQAVMVHVNVGTANTINNLTNLSRDRVPLILAAGRTPITEKGTFGSRSRPIHWAQEMFDQAGMVRELVKWDYELRVPGQIGDVVARGRTDEQGKLVVETSLKGVLEAEQSAELAIELKAWSTPLSVKSAVAHGTRTARSRMRPDAGARRGRVRLGRRPRRC